MVSQLLQQLRQVPEYFIAVKGALAVLASGLPIYAGIRYFLYKRRLTVPLHFHLAYMSSFIMFSGLSLLYASPLAHLVHPAIINTYLILTCILGSYGIMMLVDAFFVQHYLSQVLRLYISPPVRTIMRLFVFIILVFPSLHYVIHFNPLTLVAIPTIATAGLALALQDTLKTFIAGVGLGKIIRLGDWIGFQGKDGQVVDINWARTILKTVDGNYVFIPNTQLQTGLFLNYSAVSPASRIALKVGASYDAAPTRVKQILAQSLLDIPGMAANPAPAVTVQDFGDSAINYGVYCWVEDYSKTQMVQDEVCTRIWYAFRREGIEIPYPTRSVTVTRAPRADHRGGVTPEQTLQKWTLAQAFYAEELQDLLQHTAGRSYAGGERIVQQGQPGQSLFIITEGSVEVFRDDHPGWPLAILKESDVFGEMSLLTGEPRSATVRARGPVDVLEIQKAGLEQIIARRPELSDKLAQLVTQRQTVAAEHAAVPGDGAQDKRMDAPSLSVRIRRFFGL